MMHENRYDVFLSYAHKDVEGHPERNRYLKELKDGIERLAGKPLVFLDSESIQPGETWNSKIMVGIHSCKVFLCLLSRNYLNSEYCKREYLWWCQKELRHGRLRKMTLPVYYVQFSEDLADVAASSRMADELLAFQVGGVARPWFGEGENSFKEEIIRERLEDVIRRTDGFLAAEKSSELSFCSIRQYNRAFVGRLSELRQLWDYCRTERYPVLHANGGVGKTELAVAYAYGFADDYPQGRFAVPMEGVRSWNEALDRLIEGEETDPDKPEQTVSKLFGVSGGTMPVDADERKRIIWSTLKDRAKDGRLLLLLDNLDDLSLLSVKGLEKLDRRGVPGNIHIIATTRNTPELNCTSKFISFEIGNLDDDAAIELLRRYGKDAPFNLDKPSNDDPEYKAARDIACLLENHAWSLEIVGGDVGENWRRGMTFVRKLDALKKDFAVSGKNHLEDKQSAADLMEQTFLAISKAEDDGNAALELLKVAALFPAEGIPVILLKKYFEANCKGDFFTVLDVLRRYHLVFSPDASDGQPIADDGYLRMHRLTSAVVLQKFAPQHDSLIERVHLAVFPYLKNVSTRFVWREYSKTERLLLAAKPIYDELLQGNRTTFLADGVGFLWRLGQVQHFAGHPLDAEMTLTDALTSAKELADSQEDVRSSVLHCLGNVKDGLRKENEAIACYEEAVAIRKRLVAQDHDKWILALMKVSGNLAGIYKFQHRYEDAARLLSEVEEAERLLVAKDRSRNLLWLASTLWRCGNFQFALGDLKKAKDYLVEALADYRELALKRRNVVLPNLAGTLASLGDLCKTCREFDEAEGYYDEALAIRRELVTKEAYLPSLASALVGLGNLHFARNEYARDEVCQEEALSIRRELVRKNRHLYLPSLASSLNDFACVQKARSDFVGAEESWREVVMLRRELVDEMRQPYISGLAQALTNLGNVQMSLLQYDVAEKSYREAMTLYRECAQDGRNAGLKGLAWNLGSLGNLLDARHKYDEAQSCLQESLKLRRQLAAKEPCAYSGELAAACGNLAKCYYSMGEYSKADVLRQEELGLRRALVQKNRLASLPGLASVLVSLGSLQNYVWGDSQTAKTYYDEALALRRELFNVDQRAFKAGLAALLDNIGDLNKFAGKMDDAAGVYEECLHLRRDLVKESRDRYLRELAIVLRDYGELKRLMGDKQGCAAFLSEALGYDRELVSKERASNLWGLAEALRRLGDLSFEERRLEEAERECRESEGLFRELVCDSPLRHEPYLARVLLSLGRVLRAAGKPYADVLSEAMSLAEKYRGQRIGKEVLAGRTGM